MSFFDATLRYASSHTTSISLQSILPSRRTPSHPRPPTYGGRKHRSGSVVNELTLGARRSRTPQVREHELVMAVAPQHQELAPNEKSGRTVAQLLRHAGQIQADRPDASFQAGPGHHIDVT